MSDFITLTCPSCGGKLKVTDQIHLLACRNCGNEHMVVRDGGMMYLAPLAQDVRGIRVGVDKTAAELAVARLTKEISQVISETEITRKRTTAEWIAPSFLEKVLPYIILLSFILTIGQRSVLWLLILIGSILAYFMINSKRIKDVYLIRDRELDRLQTLYNNRRAALDKNRDIAES